MLVQGILGFEGFGALGASKTSRKRHCVVSRVSVAIATISTNLKAVYVLRVAYIPQLGGLRWLLSGISHIAVKHCRVASLKDGSYV